jgi:SpoIID/LytB domain protein
MRTQLLLVAAVCGLLLVGRGIAPAQTSPAPAPSSPYTAPDYHSVLAGVDPLRVLVAGHVPMLAWKGDADVRVAYAATDANLYTAPAGQQVGLVRTADGGSALRQNGKNFLAVAETIRLVSAKPILVWTPQPDRWRTLRGPLTITPLADNTFGIAQEILLEEYLRNVVSGEMPADFHPQALRAQAVIARTYTLAKLGRHADDGGDLCADVHCQVFGDDTSRAKATDDAVADTRGVVLQHHGTLVDAYYHATCGGTTDDAGLLWGPEYARPYLTGGTKDCALKETADLGDLLLAAGGYCKRSGGFRWTRVFTAAELNALVSRNLSRVTGDPQAKIDTVTNLNVEERTPNGRVARLRVEGDGASYAVMGDQARWLFGTGDPGPDGLWSTLFDLTVSRDAKGAIRAITLKGAGRGHGIGLCQWGADGRARAGQSYKEILAAYYPGTTLVAGRK